MSKTLKAKKPISKARIIIGRILQGIAITVAAGLLIFILINNYLFRQLIYILMPAPSNIERIDISMTTDERLEDFDKAYEYAVLSCPDKETFEEAYQIDFEEIYNTYREFVKECDSDMDYFYILFTFLQDIPSGHTGMFFPDAAALRKNGFQMNMDCGRLDNEDEYLYSWEKYLEESFAEYDMDNTESIGFIYYNGSYVKPYKDDSKDSGAVLLTIDGKAPDSYIYEPLQYYKIEYDEHLNKPFRKCFRFNTRYGKPVTITYELPDGNIETSSVYWDDKYNFVLEADHNFLSLDSEYKHEKEASDSDGGPKAKSSNSTPDYEIVIDDEKELVYVAVRECKTMPDFNKEYQEALTHYDNVILDIRNNGGGIVGFCGLYIYPYLFKDDMNIEDTIRMGANDLTTQWAQTMFCKIFYNARFDDDGTILYKNSIDFHGKADKDYNVYVLTNNETFSSGDITASALGRKESVTLIGTNTGGEGRVGDIFNGVLPNSHLIMIYVPGCNENLQPSNGVSGTAPDIECANTVESIRKSYALRDAGVEVNYESRQEWDLPLLKAIELIQQK